MKKQVVVIHGGDNFKNRKDCLSFMKKQKIDFERFNGKKRGWKTNLRDGLGSKFELVLPIMPNAFDARYVEWRVWFKKVIPFLRNGAILVGHSLGGTFLAKYLSENKFPKKIRATFLVAACYDDKDADYSLADFTLPKSLAKLAKQGGEIFIYQSKDDPIVPFTDFYKYKKALPGARAVVFKNKRHFTQETFPELARAIKKLK
ncbi:MAG: alpha/beta hydrolase [Minisyncoccia bacterium]|jgi:predicted alpha/beta hydrolase family esterase